MAQESSAAQSPWWELPSMPRRPQYLQLQLLMREQQPTGAARIAELALITR
jgi:hypothetical protein